MFICISFINSENDEQENYASNIAKEFAKSYVQLQLSELNQAEQDLVIIGVAKVVCKKLSGNSIDFLENTSSGL